MPNPWEEKEPVESGTPEHRRLKAELGGSRTIEFGSTEDNEKNRPELGTPGHREEQRQLFEASVLAGGVFVALSVALEQCNFHKERGTIDSYRVGRCQSALVSERPLIEIELSVGDSHIRERISESEMLLFRAPVNHIKDLVEALVRKLGSAEIQRQWERREP